MNLEEQLPTLVRNGQLEKAIQLIEKDLAKYQSTDFPKMIGKDLLHQVEAMETCLVSCISKLTSEIHLEAVYLEMNGFSTNYDLWYLDLFGFDLIGTMDDLEWLADWSDENAFLQTFTIKGLEDIQTIYQTHHENGMYQYDDHGDAADTCDYAIILRLQQLVKAAVQKGKAKNSQWASVPILVGAHDYELVYRIN